MSGNKPYEGYPGDTYDGYAKYADGSVFSTQCAEGRHTACPQPPDDDETGLPPGGGLFGGCYCECPCGHGPDAIDDGPGSLPGDVVLALAEVDRTAALDHIPVGPPHEALKALAGAVRAAIPAGTPSDPMTDTTALSIIAEWLRDPEWGAGMLEDIAEVIGKTGRTTANYPDNRSTWGRH